MIHCPTLVFEIRDLPPEDGWACYERTGRACVVCPCGTTTGFIDRAEALRVVRDHPVSTKGTHPMPQPSLGRIVLVGIEPALNNGADTAPAVITRVWSETVINVRVLVDGDSQPLWRTSLTHADALDTVPDDVRTARWTWPPRT